MFSAKVTGFEWQVATGNAAVCMFQPRDIRSGSGDKDSTH
jgi:hypothetical protein